MVKNNPFAAIDVGTTKVCSIVANIGDGGALRILGVGVTPSQGISKGMVVNIDAAKEAIRESVKKAERASGCKIESAFVGVTGRHISSMNNSGAIAITRSDKRVSPDDLKRVLESARSVPIPSDRRLLHVIPRVYALDGNVGVKDPVGMHGFRLDVETHMITASAASVQNLVKCIHSVGLEVEDLVLQPLAASEAVLRHDEREAGVILADIGGGTTDVAIFREGSVWYTSVLPVGGYQVTRDLAIGLGLPFEMAEEMKKKYANLLPTTTNHSGKGDEKKKQPDTVGLENGVSVLRQDLYEIIRSRVEEILRLIVVELPQQQYAAIAPAGLVLTGGCANTPGIDVLAREVVRLPVRIGVPQGIYGLADVLYDPAYATSVGLLLWGVKHKSEKDYLDPNLKEKVGFFFDRFRSAFPRRKEEEKDKRS